MGEVLAFSPRPQAGDWSANERGLLTLLTQQLAASYGEVDGVYGRTDSGDPWYVVTDANQDVLVHIARIDGQFVVHDAAVDMFHQVSSLWGALRQVLSAAADNQNGNVVAFNPSSREAQSFLSLVIAVGLYLELRGGDLGSAGQFGFGSLQHIDDSTIEGVASKLIAALNLDDERNQASVAPHAAVATDVASDAPISPEHGKAIAVQTASEAPAGLSIFKIAHLTATPPPQTVETAPLHALAPTPSTDKVVEAFAVARAVITGTPGDDVLIGTANGETIHGGAGNDYIDGGGAQAGQIDRLDGGAGDDRIVMGARVVASGGTGADTFLISDKMPSDKVEALLGVVLDFTAAKGDHLAVMGQSHVTVVTTALVADVLAAQGAALGEASTASQVTDVDHTVAGLRVGLDLDGDGHEDVFILLGGANAATFKYGTVIANDHATTVTVPLIGQTLSDAGHVSDIGPAH